MEKDSEKLERLWEYSQNWMATTPEEEMEMKQYVSDQWLQDRGKTVEPTSLVLAFTRTLVTPSAVEQVCDDGIFVLINVKGEDQVYFTTLYRTMGFWECIQSLESYDQDIVDEMEEVHGDE